MSAKASTNTLPYRPTMVNFDPSLVSTVEIWSKKPKSARPDPNRPISVEIGRLTELGRTSSGISPARVGPSVGPEAKRALDLRVHVHLCSLVRGGTNYPPRRLRMPTHAYAARPWKRLTRCPAESPPPIFLRVLRERCHFGWAEIIARGFVEISRHNVLGANRHPIRLCSCRTLFGCHHRPSPQPGAKWATHNIRFLVPTITTESRVALGCVFAQLAIAPPEWSAAEWCISFRKKLFICWD